MDRAGGLERRLNLGVMDPGDLSQIEEQALIGVTKMTKYLKIINF